ncbi:hypothetical protein Tco_0560690 [Tanacetum coccineum]
MTFKVLLHHYGRFTSPPGRKFVDGIVATVDPVELSNFSSNQMKAILTKCLGYDENSATFLYIKKSNRSLDSGLVLFDDAIQDIDSIVSYTQKLLHVYVSRVELSPLVVADQLEDGGLVPLADALQDRNMLLMYAQSHQNRLHVYVSRVEISPLVVADQHKDEGGKKEKHRKPSCSKKLFD